MRTAPILVLSCLALVGCASQPRSPHDQASSEAAMGMLLMASASQNDPSAARLWQVHIPPAAIQVLGTIEAYKETAGRWPTPKELKLPAGITDVTLDGTEDLAVVMKSGSEVVFRCQILKDGTVEASTLGGELTRAFQQARAQSGSHPVPVIVPPKK